MQVTFKILVAVLLGSFASVARSELVWEQTQLELHPAVGDDTAVGHFKYENKGDKAVAIKSVNSSCGCTAATAKQSAEPGEKGEVTATFKVGDRMGVQQKAITVVTDDAAHPSTTLMLKVVIPVLLELQPTFVYWQAGEAPKPKTISAKAGPGVSIKKLDVSSSSPDFVAKVEPGSSGNEFRINIEPKQTAQAATATLTIKPSLEKGVGKAFYTSARVMPPSAAGAQQAKATGPNPAGPPPQSPITATATASKGKIDACALLTSKEIQSIQGEALKDTKGSGRPVGSLSVSQCYFLLPTSSNSISLSVMQKGDGPDARDPKDYWKELFHHEKNEKDEAKEEEKESTTPTPIDGVGDEAFWIGDRVGGELYVLKGNSYIRISVGGAGDRENKIKKSKTLAQIVLKRL
jgi:uncharacterized protein DUF1573